MSQPRIGPLLRTLILPKPHSVNAMRKHGFHSNREYKNWQSAACEEIMAQGPRLLIPGPVYIEMRFPHDAISLRADTDNCAKCILDAIVSMGILIDDNRMVIPMLLLRWQPGQQTTVRIFRYLGEEE